MDAVNTTYVSDIMKVQVNVNSPYGINAVLSNPVYLSIIGAGILGIVFLIYHYWKK
jgi:hypothetical protein